MFLYPVCIYWLEAYRKPKADEHKPYCFNAEEIPDSGRKGDLHQDIYQQPGVIKFDLCQPGYACSLEHREEKQPQHFTEKIIINQFSFPFIGQIRIQFMYTLERVVFDMVSLERNSARYNMRQIGYHAGPAVSYSILE